MNDSQQVTLEDGPRLRLERRFEHSIERVWKAITDPDQLRHWFPPDQALEVTEEIFEVMGARSATLRVELGRRRLRVGLQPRLRRS